MSGRDPLKANVRRARFEHVEERLVLSASPWPALVHHAALDTVAAEQATPMVDIGGQASLENTTGGIAIAPHLNGAHAATGVNVAHADYGFYGQGQTVVVIDSGIAYDHEALGGGFGAGKRVVGGWDFAENDANPYDDAPAGFHGTHVAGIIGSDDARYTGVASQVDLVALRVFDDSGNGNFRWVEQALDWVIANQDTFENPITTVNLSLGVPHMNVDDAPAWAKFANGLESKFEALYDAGIFVAVSAGNDFAEFNTKGLSYPAVSDWVVPVSSSNDAGTKLSDFSQRDDHVLTAPGESITSTVPDELFSFDGRKNDWASASGTSMASPYVAGASVLIREAYEFMGVTDVNQQMIYDVLFDTASIINDPITAGSYHFIDVEAALGRIITDTFANDAATATAMGVMGDGYTFSEQIGQLNDRDYFSFTAEQSGRMTLSANVTHNLATHWDLVGGGGIVNGNQLAFNVVAGQSYTVGLMSDAGLGRYTVDVDVTENVVDWGVVQRNEFNNVAVSGEGWYRITAKRAGLATVEANYASGKNVTVQFYNANGQAIANGTSTNGYSRVDAQVAAGEVVLLRVTGNTSVDFNVWNVVGINGAWAEVYGDTGDDTFSFVAGVSNQVSINGLTYNIDASTASQFRFRGGGGDDTMSFTGSTRNDFAKVCDDWTQVIGAGYKVRAIDIEQLTLNGRGGYDTVRFCDSAGDDHFAAGPNSAQMTGEGFSHTATNFEKVQAHATAGGHDTATFTDSSGDDVFVGKSTFAYLKGSGFYNIARGFDVVEASASTGFDKAALFDSAGDDLFVASPDTAFLLGTNFRNSATGFDKVVAYAFAGGDDTAMLYDSTGDDLFVAGQHGSYLKGSGFFNYAKGFDSTTATAESDGNDKALFLHAVTGDVLSGQGESASLTRATQHQTATGFATVKAHAKSVGEAPSLELDSVDYYFRSFGDWNSH